VKRVAALLLIAWVAACAAHPRIEGPTRNGSGTHGAVGAGGWESVRAGIELLDAGGNAADAAAATILALAVTDHTAFCFGGEVPILDADGNAVQVQRSARPCRQRRNQRFPIGSAVRACNRLPIP